MKKTLSVLFASLLAFSLTSFAAETKKVCVDVTDKAGKTKQECKTIKVHKKFEGTKVPEKAPAK